MNESLVQSSLDPDDRGPKSVFQSEKKVDLTLKPEATKPEVKPEAKQEELPKVEEQKKEESVAQTPVPKLSKDSDED